MKRRRFVLAAALGLLALGFFALGWLASTKLGGDAKERAPLAATPDAGQTEPILLLDASIDLLPGKTLRLEPPARPEIPAP